MSTARAAAPLAPWNALAIVAFIGAFVVPPAGIVCGHIALGQVRRSGEQGHGLALAGTILGWVFTGLIALFIVLWILFAVVFFGIFASIATTIPAAVPSAP